MKTLNEGLRKSDLKDMILPLVSIDEYESKVDNDAIVVGFYVNDSDAANDLNHFIQKSAIDFLDTEVSPAPDQQGYYFVFVEFLKNTQLSKNIMMLLDEINPLVDIQSWFMTSNGETQKITSESLSRIIDSELNETIMAFFRNSLLENVAFSNNIISLKGSGLSIDAKVIDFGHQRDTLSYHHLLNTPINLAEHYSSISSKLRRILGENWTVSEINNYIAVQHYNDSRLLLLSP